MTRKLNEVFNVEEVAMVVSEPTKIEFTEEKPSANIKDTVKDSKAIRKQLKTTLEKAHTALDAALDVHNSAPDAKATESVAKLIDSVAKLTDILLSLNTEEKKFEIQLNKDSNGNVRNVTNQLNVYSTSDILDKILNKNNGTNN